MTVLQMVEWPNASERTTERYGLMPNPGRVPPTEFRSGNAVGLLAGTQDLLALCIDLLNHGFRIVAINYRDRYFNVIDDHDRTGELSDALEEGIKKNDLTDAVNALMGTGIFVENIRIRNKASGRVVTVQTDGVIDGAEASEEVPLTDAIRRVFRGR